MEGVNSPVDQRYEDPALDVRFTLPPAQNIVGPSAVMTGIPGLGFSVTET